MLECAVPELRSVIIYRSQTKVVCLLIFCALGLLAGVMMFETHPMRGGLVTGLSGIFGVLAIFGLIPSLHYIEVTREGLAIRSFTKIRLFARWSELENIRTGWLDIETMRLPWNERIFFDYLRNGQVTTASIVPSVYGLRTEEMRAFISSYRENARRRPTADAIQDPGQTERHAAPRDPLP